MASEPLVIEITAEGDSARASLDSTARSVSRLGDSGSGSARGLAAATTGFRGLISSIQRATTLFGAAGIIGGIFALVGMATRLYGIYKRLTEVNREYAAEAKKAADAAARLGQSAAGLEAIRAAAAAANIPADSLNEKLKEYAARKITFDELASSIGTSADALRRLQDQAERRSVGATALSEFKTIQDAQEEKEKQEKINQDGLKLLRRSYLKGIQSEDSRMATDTLLSATDGDTMEAARILFPAKRMKSQLQNISQSPIMMEAVERRNAKMQTEEQDRIKRLQTTLSDRAAAEAAAAPEVAKRAADANASIRSKLAPTQQYDSQDLATFRAIAARVAAQPSIAASDVAKTVASTERGALAESILSASGPEEISTLLDAAAAPVRALADAADAAARSLLDAEAAALAASEAARYQASREADSVRAAALDRIAAITVEAPRAASAAATIGGITGGTLANAARLAEQRANAAAAIQREQLTLLQQIKERLED
jgi:hypothetical protein